MLHAARAPALRVVVLVVLAVLAATGCSAVSEEEPQAETVPARGACRVLTPEDVAQPSNDSDVVDCAEAHTAETYAVGSLPEKLADAAYDDRELTAFAYDTCANKFMKFLGADESLVMRTVLTWVWFRPSEESWAAGSRRYRCDAVGGGEQSQSYVMLPETVKGALRGRPDDRWLVCVNGESVDDSPRIPCSEPHTWRAVTTIKLGEAEDKYPGDRLTEVRTRDYCSDSVVAWLDYPANYDFGYTWFREAEWAAGNRRSVCWAKTDS